RTKPLGIYCGSLYGRIRNWLTMEGACYLLVDDEALFDEIVETNAEICYQAVKTTLETGVQFDFGHFWEDICFKNGPLISPDVFRKKIGPHYRRICDLLNKYGIDIVSVDCDGWIDALVPVWLDNGVNTMFPIEVGTWNGNIKPWRKKFGKSIRGVGGMNKVVFSKDKKAVYNEIRRLLELVELGGYIPCPDHRIPPDAKWELVVYYCQEMRKLTG
ncbi:MAG TPA: uroporphyrinogen decarboxylase family protein, partial [bacterium]|nr:uroporphyrinogen decarboxylase family protein [bacterium]